MFSRSSQQGFFVFFLNGLQLKLMLDSFCAGTFVHKECERDEEQGICLPCEHGQTYTEHSNGMNRCLPCTHCRTGNDAFLSVLENSEQ